MNSEKLKDIRTELEIRRHMIERLKADYEYERSRRKLAEYKLLDAVRDLRVARQVLTDNRIVVNCNGWRFP